jgi:hypothetical protein
MIDEDEDEDDNSNVAMALQFGVRLTYSTNHGVNQVRELFFKKSLSKHPHCRIRKWMSLGFTTSPLGDPQHTHPG